MRRISIALALGLISALVVTTSALGATTVVSPSNTNGWTLYQGDTTATVGFVNGPATAPAGAGSLQYQVGSNGDDFAEVRNTSHAGTLLSNLTTLNYSTYVSVNLDCQAPYLILNIDQDGNGTTDDLLFFEPCYQDGTYGTIGTDTIDTQPAVTLNTWQQWDALKGGWWSLNDGTFGPPLHSLAGYAALYPGATIVNNDSGAGGLRIAAGGGAGAWDNFVGNADALTIGVSGNDTTYDFEPEADLELVSNTPTLPGTQTAVYANQNADENSVVFEYDVVNHGPSDSVGVMFDDTIPDGLTLVGAGFGATCTPDGALPLSLGTIALDGSVHVCVKATADSTLRQGSLNVQDSASVSADTREPDPQVYANSSSESVDIYTVPDPVTNYDVQPGNGNAIASWKPPVVNGGATIDYYELVVSATPSGGGQGTFDIYPPGTTHPPAPVGFKVWTPCAGRLGGTLCFNVQNLTNKEAVPSIVYTFTIQAHNAVGLSDIDTNTKTATPSTNNLAKIVGTTSTSLATCTEATTANPICIQYSIPNGGGGVFSLQDSIPRDSLCTGSLCNSLNLLASFEGHPPTGYATASNPIKITVTWDATIAPNGTKTKVYYQADGDVFQLPKCISTNVANPDPCVQFVRAFPFGKSGTCKPKSQCYGDIQGLILLTSFVDGGIYHK
ncbi:MAG: hypothetical protein M3P11_05015 [Actinomycetota bacterium]|nr:hypothetical protein [Actinomycetota bacterium]